MVFSPIERFILSIIAILAALDVALILVKQIEVDVAGYGFLLACGFGIVALGQFYRIARNEPRLSAPLTATGLFIVFSLVGSVFNYLLLPILFSPIDPILVRIDTLLGYNWPDLVIWISHYPMAGAVLRFVYMSSLPQIVVIILLLGFSNHIEALYRFLLTGIFGALIAMLCWFFFPSFGASSVYALPQETLDAMPLMVGPEYGAELVRLAREGVSSISPVNALGLIGFPSFHTVMACMSVFFVRRFNLFFVVALLVNLIMIPAIFVQGGHHLSDVLGGIAVFGLAFYLSGLVLRQRLSADFAPRSPVSVLESNGL